MIYLVNILLIDSHKTATFVKLTQTLLSTTTSANTAHIGFQCSNLKHWNFTISSKTVPQLHQ